MFNVSEFHYTYSRYAVFQVSVEFCLRDSSINEDIYTFRRTIIIVLLVSITVRKSSCFSIEKSDGKREQEELNMCVVFKCMA